MSRYGHCYPPDVSKEVVLGKEEHGQSGSEYIYHTYIRCLYFK
jgi:hypothetical protein